jgi:hypothetical protein
MAKNKSSASTPGSQPELTEEKKKEKEVSEVTEPLKKKKEVEVATKEETASTDSGDINETLPDEETQQKKELGEPPEASPALKEWVQEMKTVPVSHVYGAGSTQENRCTEDEIKAVVEATVTTFGIARPTAFMAISELIRRGGANAGTPDSFSVDIRCAQQHVTVSVSKRDVFPLIKRLANNKTMRNLAEGMSELIVRHNLELIQDNPGVDRPGDLAKKVDNRLSFNQEEPLTPQERVGCASYTQWIPHLNELVGSKRLKSLLAQDLFERKQKRSTGPQEGGSKGTTKKEGQGAKNTKKEKQGAKSTKKKRK